MKRHIGEVIEELYCRIEPIIVGAIPLTDLEIVALWQELQDCEQFAEFQDSFIRSGCGSGSINQWVCAQSFNRIKVFLTYKNVIHEWHHHSVMAGYAPKRNGMAVI